MLQPTGHARRSCSARPRRPSPPRSRSSCRRPGPTTSSRAPPPTTASPTSPASPIPCAFPGVALGTDLLVLDLDNGKSVWCSVIGPPAAGARAGLVLDTEEFEADRRPRPVADPRPHHLVAHVGRDARPAGGQRAAAPPRAGSPAVAGAELRRRPEHGPAHRPAGRCRPRRPRRRDRRRPRIAHPSPARHRRRGDGDRGGRRPRRRPCRGRCRRQRSCRRRPAGWTGRRCCGEQPAVLVANLPYNVATPIVADLLDDVPLIRADAGDGAGRGRRTGWPPARASKAYGAVSVKVAYWARGLRRRPGAADGVPPPSPRWTRRSWPSTAATCPPGRPASPPDELFALGPGGVRPAPQDAAPFAGRPGRTRRTSSPPGSIRAPGPSSSTSTPGAAWRWPSVPARAVPVVIRPGAGQADPEPADHGGPRRRLPPARRRDGDARPGRHAHLHRR